MSNLLPHALLGTQRKSALPETDLSQLTNPTASPEETLLTLAGALFLRTRVGAQPQHFLTPPKTSATEDKPYCSAELAGYLRLVLDGVHPELLPDILSALAEAGARVPELFIPELLDRGLKRYPLRSAVIQTIGDTGRWLATHNPDWRYAAPDFDWDAIRLEWNHKAPSRRQGALYQLRQRDPAGARALLKSTWQRETSSPLWMLRLLEPTLSLQDEPFLERALDHRNVTVRRKAADLLTRLPESQLSQRMSAQVSKVLSYRPRLKRVDIAFPDTLTPELLRGGVLLRNWKDKDKVRRAQVVDMVSAVPVKYWLESWNLNSQALVQAAANSAWRAPLFKGFASAAERQKCSDLAFELLKQDALGVSTQKLVSVLEAGQVLDLAVTFASELAKGDLDFPKRKTIATAFVKLLSRWTQPWSPELLQEFLAALPDICRFEEERTATVKLKQAKLERSPGLSKNKALRKKPALATNTATLRNLLRQAARRAPPELAPATARAILAAAESSSFYPHAQAAADLLTFRAHFYRDLHLNGDSK